MVVAAVVVVLVVAVVVVAVVAVVEADVRVSVTEPCNVGKVSSGHHLRHNS